MQYKTTSILAITLGCLISLFTTTVVAADRTCDDNQVYSAVMKSAENDLPAPYNKGDVIGSKNGGHKTNVKNQCKMTLLFNMNVPNANILYNIDVPLANVRVRLVDDHKAELDRVAKAMGDEGEVAPKTKCKQIMFPKGSVSTSLNGVVAGFNKEQETIPSQCYKVTTGKNQTAKFTITSTNSNTGMEVTNMGNKKIISHDGGDNKLEFLTKKTTYKINVSQFMPTPDSDNYTLMVEVR